MTIKEIHAFLLFYENMIRPKFHNFLNIYDDSSTAHTNWNAYVAINQKIAQKIVEVRS